MNNKSYIFLAAQSDEAIEEMIGQYVRKVRQEQGRTQDELSKSAGISRSTLSLLERGSSGNLSTLIRVLRVLGKLDALGTLQYKELLSPLALARVQHKQVERVRKPAQDTPKDDHHTSTW